MRQQRALLVAEIAQELLVVRAHVAVYQVLGAGQGVRREDLHVLKVYIQR